MRKLKCFQIGGNLVQEILDEFNERAKEFGVFSEEDIVTVSAMHPTLGTKIPTASGDLVSPRVEVVIVYWSGTED